MTSSLVIELPESRPRVLVIDDSPLVRKVIAKLLEQKGVEVVEALLDGADETTLRHPDVVNARRPGATGASRV